MFELARQSTNVIDLRDAGFALMNLGPFLLVFVGAWLAMTGWRARVGATLAAWAVMFTIGGA